MYAVTVFVASDDDEADGVEAHPSVWLTPQRTHCRWPVVTRAESLATAIKKCIEPCDSWTTHNVHKILSICREYYLILLCYKNQLIFPMWYEISLGINFMIHGNQVMECHELSILLK